MATCTITSYGAVADAVTNNAPALQAAIDACSAAGGGRVIIPAGGIYLSGSIDLKSHVELHLEYGAVLRQTTNLQDFTHFPHFSHVLLGRWPALLTAHRAQHIAVTGGGTVEAQGKHYVAEDLGHIYRMTNPRPSPIFFRQCRNVTLRDFTIEDAPGWTIRLSGCADVTIDALHILNDLKTPNSDGIDLDRCQSVRISNCHIESGDDCIVLKAMEETAGMGNCEGITVRGCTLVSTSSALIVGCEARSVMRDVIFDSCIIRRSHRGLAIHLSEEADIENVIFSNMIVETRLFHPKWWGRGEPIYICVYPWTAEHQIGRVRQVRFSNILARGENGVFIEAQRPGLIDDVLLENVRVELNKTSRWPGGHKDIRPWPADVGGPGPAGELPAQSTAGFYIRNAAHVTMRHCAVAWGAKRPDYFRHALEAHAAPGLVVEDFQGAAASAAWPAQLIEG